MGEPVSVTQVWDSEEEARTIGEEIEQYQRAGEALNSMAILVRASFQMREFEERFITLGLNYRVIGGPRFYERKEIRDALAYLRLVAQPADDLAFERIINVPKRGIGDATVKMLMETARHQNASLLSATRLLLETEELKPKQRTTLRGLIGQFDDWSFRSQTLKPFELVEQILEESGYIEMHLRPLTEEEEEALREGEPVNRVAKSAEEQGRLENLKELSRSMEEFDTLGGFLEHIALVMDRDVGE